MSYRSAVASVAKRFLAQARKIVSRPRSDETRPGEIYFTELSAVEIALHVELAPRRAWRKLTRRWQKALRLHPDSARILNNLGVAYEQRGLFDLAGQSYRKALELAPDNTVVRRNYELFEKATKTSKA